MRKNADKNKDSNLEFSSEKWKNKNWAWLWDTIKVEMILLKLLIVLL